MKEGLAHRGEIAQRLPGCALRFALAALLCRAQIFGGYAPFALGLVAAAGRGWDGLFALLGCAAGAAVFLDFSHALRTVAAAVLIHTANRAFFDQPWYRKKLFLPLLTAGLMGAVEFVYVLQGDLNEAAGCLIAMLAAALCAYGLRPAAPGKQQPAAALTLALGGLTALASLHTGGGFSPGRIAAVAAVLLLGQEAEHALPAALCIGLCMDLAAQSGGFVCTAAYAAGALALYALRPEGRVRAALIFAGTMILFSLPLSAEQGLILLFESLAGTLLFLLLPARAVQGKHLAAQQTETDAGESGLRRRVEQSALALRELYDSVARAPRTPEENPAAIFDRAAERVCRDCSLCNTCWEKEYSRTYNALNDATGALLRRGQGKGVDFPAYFSDRCIRFPSFLSAVNTELQAYLLRRQYRAQLSGARAQAAGQYAELSELLSAAASTPAMGGTLLPYRVGLSMRPKHGEHVCGDCLSDFETENGRLCLLLSDGMGSGEGAHRESAMAVRLLERFLRAGIDAAPALRTVNSALTLRAETTDSFTTIDLLSLSLQSGEGELYKYGAAPSYIKRGGKVRRLSSRGLPAGLQSGDMPPETVRVQLQRGSFFVMVTDGVADSTDDEWLQNLLAGWEGDNPQLLAAAILADSREKRGETDDASVLALYLPGGAQEV